VAPAFDWGVKHSFLGGLNKKKVRREQGKTVGTKNNNYEHFGLWGGGMAGVKMDAHPRPYPPPAVITVPANKNHTIHALTDIEWFCIHATDETDSEKVDRVLIKGD